METSSKYWQSTNETISNETRMVLNEYLLSLKLANKAALSIVVYRRILERFLSQSRKPLNLLTSDDVLKWLNESSIDKKEKMIEVWLSALSSFFKFCLAETKYGRELLLKFYTQLGFVFKN